MHELEKLLASNVDSVNVRYFVSNQLSVIDIQYYVEISTVMILQDRDLSSKQFPTLVKWYEAMQ